MRVINIFIFGIAVAQVLLVCCTSSKSRDGEISRKEIDSIEIVKDTSSRVASSDVRTYQTSRNYKTFWKEFRQAVLNSDSIKLEQMTSFPLKTHGHLDQDPQIDIQRNVFYKAFKMMLSESHVEHDSLAEDRIVSCFDEVRRDRTFVKNGGEADPKFPFDFCNMVFRCDDLGWKLELIYLDTNELKKKLQR